LQALLNFVLPCATDVLDGAVRLIDTSLDTYLDISLYTSLHTTLHTSLHTSSAPAASHQPTCLYCAKDMAEFPKV
jgi:hypothetical protein